MTENVAGIFQYFTESINRQMFTLSRYIMYIMYS